MINLRKKIRVKVTEKHIEEAKCRDPNKCMVRMAVIDAVGKNCYCKVDLTHIAITRRGDYREKAFLAPKAARALVRFDGKQKVEPFEFDVEFMKSTPIYKAPPGKMAKMYDKRAKDRANGIKQKKYGKAYRSGGVAMETV